jgi:rhodanese-related sulfurtransferase
MAVINLTSAYAWSNRLDDAKQMLDLAFHDKVHLDTTARGILAKMPRYGDPDKIMAEQRVVEGLRRAGLRDHLDEDADSGVPSDSTVRPFDRLYGPTPMSVPGGHTVRTEELRTLLSEQKMVVLTTSNANPSVPGAILTQTPELGPGETDDRPREWLQRMAGELTDGDKTKPIVTFGWSINHWNARNLALSLISRGYTNVYWYRGGWEAWDAHDQPLAPLMMPAPVRFPTGRPAPGYPPAGGD